MAGIRRTSSAWLARAWRLSLLALAVWLIRTHADQHLQGQGRVALTVERVRDFFPDAEQLGVQNPATGWLSVLDDQGQPLGFVTTTAPASDNIIGYSGPTTTLIAFENSGAVRGLRILKSHDTPDHLAEVVSDRRFFTQFRGLKPGSGGPQPLHVVTGATLTSTAIAQGVLGALGNAAGTSMRFPEEITLAEVQRLAPEAVSLRESRLLPQAQDVLDAQSQVIGIAVRTSPITDALVGYKGPTDTLMLLDPKGEKLQRIAIRKSYDTRRYVAYVTGDDYFLNLFNQMALERLATLDFTAAKVEGVSGATETSWSVAEGLKRRAQNLIEERRKQSETWWSSVRWRWQDTGHVLVILSALLMSFTHLRGIAWLRHLHHAGLVLYVGFLAGEILSQSLFAGWAGHGTPWKNAPGLVLLGIVALLAPVFTGKQLYCHHICPHGALQQLLARRLPWQLRLSRKVDKALAVLPLLLLGFVLFAVVRSWHVDLNDIEPFDAYVPDVAGWATLTIAIVGLIAAMFTPLAYCKYGCPSGALFRILRSTGDNDRLGLRDWLAAAVLGVAWLV